MSPFDSSIFRHPDALRRYVNDVFGSVATHYDTMNDCMSLGLHRAWKHHFVTHLPISPKHRILDVAGGTGDIASRIWRYWKTPVMVCDVNPAMLTEGRKKAIDKNEWPHFTWITGDAESLPIASNAFDIYTIAFGLRNVADREKALREAWRVLKPGGHIACLEFSPQAHPFLQPLYEVYSDNVIPLLGSYIAQDRDAYVYLVESIRRFPPPETVETLWRKVGFRKVKTQLLGGGIVAVYSGWKY